MRYIRFTSIVVLSVILLSCVRRPGSYSMSSDTSEISYNSSRTEEHLVRSKSRKSTRASRAIHSVTHDKSLPQKVQQLANQIERKMRADSYTADDLEVWMNLYVEYTMEYSLSTQNLSDEQCESIEFNLGRIAGVIYRDGIAPVLSEIKEIGEGLEDYEVRSKKWEGAGERGFNSVAGEIDW